MSMSARHVSFAVPATLESAGLARHMVTAVLHAWRATVDQDVTLLLVSEVFTNALLHGEPSELDVTARIGVEIVETLDGLHIEVHDPDQGDCHVAAVTRASVRDEVGRGLALVQALSTRWGQTDTQQGKYVYFDVEDPGLGQNEATGDTTDLPISRSGSSGHVVVPVPGCSTADAFAGTEMKT